LRQQKRVLLGKKRMENHPNRNKLEQWLHGKIGGQEALEILLHVEKCDYCFENSPPQDLNEFIARLLGNEDVQTIDELVDELKTKTKSRYQYVTKS
jgi:hypothetical protein